MEENIIRSISMLANTEAPIQATAPAVTNPQEGAKVDMNAPQDTFVPSVPKAEEAPQADPNDKFVKAEEKPEETK